LQAIDGALLATHPENHTVGCMLLEACRESGFLLLDRVDGSYAVVATFDNSSNAAAITYLNRTSETNNVYVSVTGTSNNGSPPTISGANIVSATQVTAAAPATVAQSVGAHQEDALYVLGSASTVATSMIAILIAFATMTM
jgi:hypothetical protein